MGRDPLKFENLDNDILNKFKLKKSAYEYIFQIIDRQWFKFYIMLLSFYIPSTSSIFYIIYNHCTSLSRITPLCKFIMEKVLTANSLCRTKSIICSTKQMRTLITHFLCFFSSTASKFHYISLLTYINIQSKRI
jgi:hypothetical protein